MRRPKDVTRPDGGVFRCGHPRLNNAYADGAGRTGKQEFRCRVCKLESTRLLRLRKESTP